jgi:hypothetical protein
MPRHCDSSVIIVSAKKEVTFNSLTTVKNIHYGCPCGGIQGGMN